MSDATPELRRIHWAECCGFPQLFRAFRLAINPTVLCLALCGVLLTYSAGRILDRVWPLKHCAVQAREIGGGTSELDMFNSPAGGGCTETCKWRDDLLKTPEQFQRVGPFKLLLGHASTTINQAGAAVLHLNPGGLKEAIRTGVMGKVWLVAMHPVYGILFFGLNLIIWAFFGGAICRVVALQATRDERLGFRAALAFAQKKFLSFVAAPLMPVSILVLLAIPLYLGGWLGAIPWLGDILATILFFLALLAGFVMAFVIIGAAAGCSLMYPTIAVEGSDAFDALSRSFSFIYSRPWRSAFYAVVSMAYGAICLLFVKFFARLMLAVVHIVVGWSMNHGDPSVTEKAGAAVKELGKLDAMWQAPSLTGATPFWGGLGSQDLAHVSAFGQFWIYLWVFIVVGLVGAFVISFYYAASTMIYLLLRREVDATDLEEVYVEERLEETAPPPAAAAGTAPGEQKPPEGGPIPETGQAI